MKLPQCLEPDECREVANVDPLSTVITIKITVVVSVLNVTVRVFFSYMLTDMINRKQTIKFHVYSRYLCELYTLYIIENRATVKPLI